MASMADLEMDLEVASGVASFSYDECELFDELLFTFSLFLCYALFVYSNFFIVFKVCYFNRSEASPFRYMICLSVCLACSKIVIVCVLYYTMAYSVKPLKLDFECCLKHGQNRAKEIK